MLVEVVFGTRPHPKAELIPGVLEEVGTKPLFLCLQLAAIEAFAAASRSLNPEKSGFLGHGRGSDARASICVCMSEYSIGLSAKIVVFCLHGSRGKFAKELCRQSRWNIIGNPKFECYEIAIHIRNYIIVSVEKELKFRGSSEKDYRGFPKGVTQDIGYQLHLVQCNRTPANWKPMTNVGAGVYEIIEQDQAGFYRVIYTVKFADYVYVLHCFSKKTNKTSQRDLDLASDRYRELVAELKK
ncbi:type II toxin-antitoxin system RelE/ParE family toxin [Aureimonas psammosilenae]|uniref:type II toxin-antitoxin system RelE/ParE family toxin n=1 Tax=Aureimonas psammosilenae TaxID=2495496 RepID=UPI001F332D16|nr:type II toxin-antitoxin system RelE/ParE family toxin [Aureimonas psammosilenae]